MLDFLGMSDPQRILDRAKKLEGQGKDERAIAALEKGLRGDSADFDLLLELARLHLKKGSSREAAASLKRAYSADDSRLQELLDRADNLHYESDTPLETGAFLFEVSIDRRDFEQANRYLDGMNQNDIGIVTERYKQRLDSISKYKSEKEMGPKDVSVLYQLALLLVRSNRFEDADMLFRKGIEILPADTEAVISEYGRIAAATYGDPKPRIAFGDLLVASGDIKRALELYRSAIEFDKSAAEHVIVRLETVKEHSPDPEVEKYLSELYIAHSQLDEAMSLVKKAVSAGTLEMSDALKKLREVIRLDPDNPKGHLALGDAYIEDGSIDVAVSEYKEALELAPNLAAPLAERLSKIVAEHPKDSPAVELLANIYLEQDDINSAVETLRRGFDANVGMADDLIPMLRKVLAEDLENGPALLLLARAYSSQEKTREALLLLDTLVSLGEGSAREALRELLPIVERERDNPAAVASLGTALLAVNSSEKAVEVIRGIRDLPKNAPKIMERVFDMCRKRPELAAGAVEILSAMDVKGVDRFALSMVLGEVLAISGNIEAAAQRFSQSCQAKPEAVSDVIAAYERLLEKNEEVPSVHLGLANCYLKVGDTDGAAREFARVLSLDRDSFDSIVDRYYELLRVDPKKTAVRMVLVDAFVDRGMWDQVREECEKAQEVVAAEQSGYFLLKKGQALIEKGLLSQAVPLIGRAIQLDSALLDEANALALRIMKLDPKNTSARLTRARIAARNGEFETAASEFIAIQKMRPEGTRKIISEVRKLLEKNKTDPHLRFCLGELLFEVGSVEEASAHLEAATDMDDSFAERAIHKYEQMISEKGGYAFASLSLGRAYMKRGSYALATQNLLAALRADPELREPVLHDLNEVLENQPGDVTSRFALADIYREDGDLRRSVSILKEISDLDITQADAIAERLRSMIEEDEKDVSLRYLLAELLVKRRALDPAVQVYEEIMAANPDETERVIGLLRDVARADHPRALRAFATALTNRAQHEEAVDAISRMTEADFTTAGYGITLLEQIHAADPRLSSAVVVLGRLLLNTKEYSRAAETLKSGIDRAKDRSAAVECMLLLSRALALTGKADEARSEIGLAYATAEDPKKVYPRLAEIIRSERSLRLSELEEELGKEPERGDLRIESSSLRRGIGELDGAFGLLQFASDTPEIEAKRCTELALCLDAMGEPVSALEVLKGLDLSGIKESPQARESLNVLAYLYERTQQYPQAVAVLSELVSLKPSHLDAQRRLSRLSSDFVVRSLHNRPNIIDGVMDK
jgi:tetratricopeptide (TPR) repeat protein